MALVVEEDMSDRSCDGAEAGTCWRSTMTATCYDMVIT